MVDPTPLSPLLRDLCAKVAPIEARLAVLDAEIATREQERDGLRSTLAGICRALDPEQVTLPLPGLGTEATPLREPSRMAETLLRAAMVPRATDPLFVRCSICEADPGHPCRAVEGQAFDGSPHVNRAADAEEWANAPTIWRLSIPRDSMHRGELKCAHALAAGIRPLLVEESRTKASVVYRLTADGETVARALPAKGGEGA